jgi:hypothetical protein
MVPEVDQTNEAFIEAATRTLSDVPEDYVRQVA